MEELLVSKSHSTNQGESQVRRVPSGGYCRDLRAQERSEGGCSVSRPLPVGGAGPPEVASAQVPLQSALRHEVLPGRGRRHSALLSL